MKIANEQMSWEAAVLWLRSRPEHAELATACFFDDPLTAAAERYYSSTEWRAVMDLIGTHGGSALDLGSGRGISAYALAKDGWQVTALEPDSSDEVGAGAIRRLAAETDMNIRVVQTWGENLPFESNSFDLVHCRQVLHHAKDLRQLCIEAARVLKPGGRIIATREHVISRPQDLELFLNSHPLHRLYGGERAYTLKEYTNAITSAGIRLEKVINPLGSDINLYPQTVEIAKSRWSRRFGIPPRFISNRLLFWIGARMNRPGRIYSFVGLKSQPI